VAGSDDLTGNEEFGGDWELEVATSSIEAVTLLSADTASAFSGVLGPLDDTDGDGILDGVDVDDDNDGILDTEEVKVNDPYQSTGIQTLAGNSTTTGAIDLTSLGYSIGDTITIDETNILLAGDFVSANETVDIVFNNGLIGQVATGDVNSAGAATGANGTFSELNDPASGPLAGAGTMSLTVVDLGSGVPGLTYDATTTIYVSN